MKRRYLCTLEIAPLVVGRTYDTLPSHLTLMSRFWSDMSPEALAAATEDVFAGRAPIQLRFGALETLGPKKVQAHMVTSVDEAKLHADLKACLDELDVEYEYPQFVGDGHKAHVTHREGVDIVAGSTFASGAAYLIEVVDHKRVVRARFVL